MQMCYLERLFLAAVSSLAKTCTVPWSLETQSSEESWLKLMLQVKQDTKESLNRGSLQDAVPQLTTESSHELRSNDSAATQTVTDVPEDVG